MVERFRQTPDRVVGFGGRSRAELSGPEVIYGRFDPAKPPVLCTRIQCSTGETRRHHPQRWLDLATGLDLTGNSNTQTVDANFADDDRAARREREASLAGLGEPGRPIRAVCQIMPWRSSKCGCILILIDPQQPAAIGAGIPRAK